MMRTLAIVALVAAGGLIAWSLVRYRAGDHPPTPLHRCPHGDLIGPREECWLEGEDTDD